MCWPRTPRSRSRRRDVVRAGGARVVAQLAVLPDTGTAVHPAIGAVVGSADTAVRLAALRSASGARPPGRVPAVRMPARGAARPPGRAEPQGLFGPRSNIRDGAAAPIPAISPGRRCRSIVTSGTDCASAPWPALVWHRMHPARDCPPDQSRDWRRPRTHRGHDATRARFRIAGLLGRLRATGAQEQVTAFCAVIPPPRLPRRPVRHGYAARQAAGAGAEEEQATHWPISYGQERRALPRARATRIGSVSAEADSPAGQ